MGRLKKQQENVPGRIQKTTKTMHQSVIQITKSRQIFMNWAFSRLDKKLVWVHNPSNCMVLTPAELVVSN